MSQPQLPEQDKPFVLALIGTGATILFGVLAALKVSFMDPAQAADAFKSVGTLTAMAWGYYFAKKA